MNNGDTFERCDNEQLHTAGLETECEKKSG